MDSDERRTQLRGARFRADGAAVVELLRTKPWPATTLQPIGDALMVAIGQRIVDAPALARDCVAELRERGWDGDDELADQLDALLGTGPTPLLRPLPVDLDELAGVLEGDPLNGDGRIDRLTGEVWPASAIEYAAETDEDEQYDEERWLHVPNTGSRGGYGDMVEFVGTVADEHRVERLEVALHGRGAFRRFRDVLDRWPAELERWHAFSDDRRFGRARAWLAEVGYRVAPPDRAQPHP